MKGVVVFLFCLIVWGSEAISLEKLRHYEEVSIGLHGKRNEEDHPWRMALGFHAYGMPFQLFLTKQTDLMAESYVHQAENWENGKRISVEMDDSAKRLNCYYRGHHADQTTDTLVAVSACNGLTGLIFAHGETFHVEPHPLKHKRDPSSHIIFRGSDLTTKAYTCGTTHSDEFHSVVEAMVEKVRSKKASVPDSTPRYISFLVVNDKGRYTSLGSSLSTTEQDTLTIVNIVKSIYEGFTLNVKLSLIRQITITGTDPWSVTVSGNTVNSDQLLGAFETWVASNTFIYDAAHLLSNYDFDGNVVGKARTETMCTNDAIGVNQATYQQLSRAYIATTVAHELGHNFGMYHDGTSDPGRPDNTGCPNQGFVMAAVSNPSAPSITFSTCSAANMRAYEAGATVTCYQQSCGNGVVEGTEACDNSTDPCCDNCAIKAGCVCATSQPCCSSDGLSFKAAGTVCRAAAGQCDTAETCTGSSALCPDNTPVNGTSCTDVFGLSGACYLSYCLSGLLQCKQRNSSYVKACKIDECGSVGCSFTDSCTTFDQFPSQYADGTPCGSGLQCYNGFCVSNFNCSPVSCSTAGKKCGKMDNKCGNKNQKCGADCLGSDFFKDNCFIATAAYGSPMDPHVESLRIFRDRFLLTSSVGSKFVDLYYTYSPSVAALIEQSYYARSFVRALLWPLVFVVENILL